MPTATTDAQNAGDRRAGQSAETSTESLGGFSVSSPSIVASTPGVVNPQPEAPYNELVVRCLRIAYRRGRAIREAQAHEASGGEPCQQQP